MIVSTLVLFFILMGIVGMLASIGFNVLRLGERVRALQVRVLSGPTSAASTSAKPAVDTVRLDDLKVCRRDIETRRSRLEAERASASSLLSVDYRSTNTGAVAIVRICDEGISACDDGLRACDEAERTVGRLRRTRSDPSDVDQAR